MPPANVHQFTSRPITNPWNVATAAQPSYPPPVVPSDPRISYPVIIAPQLAPQPVIVPATRRGPGRPAGTGAHQMRRRSTHAAAAVPEEVAGDKEIVTAPYQWATTSPFTVHSLSDLISKKINVISGQVQCKRCEKIVTVEYNLKEKFVEISRYIAENKEELRDRAPSLWMNPRLPTCETCETGMKPVISQKKEDINWLFLLLGQMLGCCTLEQLKYFCYKTQNHRTGAKDRVLYLTYLTLCNQLDPAGTFSR
ncbi:PREDICTED: uncharacterized protein LOC104805442 [Tarenaya hassleriana]|uniref:uncharacterized protein LOC104805442 n=1 Tax=Tarenaya hassleriana TaxID=28532 RepID=UPI00053C544F|nr:PREDICTED: uncharacterized protein LOC104805442 [Tarenaya hassleriana]